MFAKEDGMYVLIICALVGIVSGFYAERKSDYAGDKISGLMIGGLIGLIIGSFAVLIIGASLPSEYALSNQSELVALEDYGSTEGSFFLGCGSINEQFYYFFTKKTQMTE